MEKNRLLNNVISLTATIIAFAYALNASALEPTDSYDVLPLQCERDGMTIDGELLLPKSDEPLPLVICAHGFGGNRFNVQDYAKTFAENGVAAYIFDFIGGGRNSKSDGKTSEMSVLTEASDLGAILDVMTKDARFNNEQIFLFGESQGGFVSTYVACKRPTDVAALIALYPAYVIQDDAKKRSPDPDKIPETFNFMGLTIGAVYTRDALAFDIYELMNQYDRQTLLIHGNQDWLVPYAYSQRAAQIFPNAKLVKIEGAGHGFRGQEKEFAAQTTLEFIKDVVAQQTTENEQK